MLALESNREVVGSVKGIIKVMNKSLDISWVVNPCAILSFQSIYSISYPSVKGDSMEKLRIFMSLSKPIYSRLELSEVSFKYKNLSVLFLQRNLQVMEGEIRGV